MLALSATAFMVSCSTTDDDDTGVDGGGTGNAATYVGDKYVGTTTVSSSIPLLGSYSSDNTVIYLDVKSNSVTLICTELSLTDGYSYFEDGTTIPVDVMVSDIPKVDNYYYTKSAVATNIKGEAYDTDIVSSIEDVTISFDGDYVYIEFVCKILVNGVEYSFNVSFDNESQASSGDDDKEEDKPQEEEEPQVDNSTVVEYVGSVSSYIGDYDGDLDNECSDVEAVITIYESGDSIKLTLNNLVLCSDLQDAISLSFDNLIQSTESLNIYYAQSATDTESGDYTVSDIYVQFWEESSNILSIMFDIEIFGSTFHVRFENSETFSPTSTVYYLTENNIVEEMGSYNNQLLVVYYNEDKSNVSILAQLYYGTGYSDCFFIVVDNIPFDESFEDSDYYAASITGYDSYTNEAYDITDIGLTQKGDNILVWLYTTIGGQDYLYQIAVYN